MVESHIEGTLSPFSTLIRTEYGKESFRIGSGIMVVTTSKFKEARQSLSINPFLETRVSLPADDKIMVFSNRNR